VKPDRLKEIVSKIETMLVNLVIVDIPQRLPNLDGDPDLYFVPGLLKDMSDGLGLRPFDSSLDSDADFVPAVQELYGWLTTMLKWLDSSSSTAMYVLPPRDT
jgi:hypothetical protein